MAVPPPDSSSFPHKEAGFTNQAIAYPQAGATRHHGEKGWLPMVFSPCKWFTFSGLHCFVLF